jgi:hypothetical protein
MLLPVRYSQGSPLSCPPNFMPCGDGMNRVNQSRFRFTLRNLLLWVTLLSVAIACFRLSLAGSNGWLVGYPRMLLFSAALLLMTIVVGAPMRRLSRHLVWPFAAAFCLIIATTGFLIWYTESFMPIFIERGVADPGQITLKKLSVDAQHIIVIKYDVSDLPNCENTGHLLPWRDGYRSLSDDYLATRPGR